MLNRNLRTQEEAATIAAVAYATATADGGTITTATTEDLDKLKPNEKKKPKEVEELIISRRAYKRFFFKQLDVVRRLVAELPASDQKQYDITVESKKLKSKWFNYEESMNKIIQNEQADETTIEEETVRLNADQEELDEIKTQVQLKKEAFNAQKEKWTATKLGAIPKTSKASSSYTSLGATKKYGANRTKTSMRIAASRRER